MNKVISSERLPIKMWLDDLEEGALEQAKNLANLPFAWKWISIMPDAHRGYGMPIGGVMATEDVIVPNAVGVDIACGVIAVELDITEIDADTIKKIMGKTREVIPVGFNHQKEPQKWDGFNDAPDIQIIQQELTSAKKQLGTLGSGNHFIEIQQAVDDGHIWIMIHSGSRNIGYKVANEYHKKAKDLCERWHSDIPHKDLSFLPFHYSSPAGEYFEAMKFCLDFAKENRAQMMDVLGEIMYDFTGSSLTHCLDVHHNYASMEHHYGKNVLIHRKGAILAREGTEGIVPGSMGANSYIVEGKGNSESFHSCSHGAGRRMGRNEAKRTLKLESEQKKMDGIMLCGLRSKSQLDEAPGAYKDIETVMKNQEDLVKITKILKPLSTIKDTKATRQYKRHKKINKGNKQTKEIDKGDK